MNDGSQHSSNDDMWTGMVADPLATADASLPGVRALIAAREALLRDDAAAAVSAAADARRVGVPAELQPHLFALHGAAFMAAGRLDEAITQLADGWSQFPDVAVLPALLGAAHSMLGDHRSAAHEMYASLVSDDPDASLAVHRRTLGRFFTDVRRGG